MLLELFEYAVSSYEDSINLLGRMKAYGKKLKKVLDGLIL